MANPLIALMGKQFDPMAVDQQIAQTRQLEQQNKLADFAIGDKQRDIASENMLSKLLAGGGDVANGLAQAGYGAKALGYLKQQTDRQKAEADIAKDKAIAAKSEADAGGTVMGMYRDQLNTVNDPQTAAKWAVSMFSDPKLKGFLTGTPDEAVARIPTDPAGFAQWKLQASMNAEKLAAYMQKEREFSLKSANEAFTIGPDGKPVANAAYQDFQLKKAKAGKTDVNLAVNTEKGFLGEVAKGVGNSVESSMNQAKAAVGTLNNISQIRSALDSGKIITGPGADTKILLKQMGVSMGLGGKDDAETLANTRSAMQAMAGQELNAAEAMKGQGAITENERTLIKRAASGDITMTAPEIRSLTQAIEKTARYKIRAHAENVKRLGGNPSAAPIVDFMRVDEPSASPVPQSAGGGFKYLGKE